MITETENAVRKIRDEFRATHFVVLFLFPYLWLKRARFHWHQYQRLPQSGELLLEQVGFQSMKIALERKTACNVHS